MKTLFLIFFACLLSEISIGQDIDTLTFHSQAFNEDRTVFIHKPEFYNYQSETVQLPVIYVLDGQHSWFINPLLSNIKYLQYTHEIPGAIVVVIPHKNRYTECPIKNIKEELPLHKFITEELDEQLKAYHPNDFKIIIGHSFSASFALYSYYRNPSYYAAVIANTPLNKLENLVAALDKKDVVEKQKISISIGGIAKHKDMHHRKSYEEIKTKFPSFFNSINTFEADNSAHTAVPIVATPSLLTKIFADFSGRYAGLAVVNDNYELVNAPKSIDGELKKIVAASKIGTHFYPPEVPDLNGIASRYSYNKYNDYAINVFELAIEYYPNYYDFHLSLYQLSLLENNKEKAKAYLNKAEELLKTIELDSEEKDEMLEEISTEKTKNGWE